jgi:CheY-like chemotaxis protein
MGEHERVLLIEDDLRDARNAIEELTGAGHELVGSANNFEDAIKLISDIDQSNPTVVVLDGNLRIIDEPRDNCMDGRRIARLIKRASKAIIVAHSHATKEIADFGDIYVGKEAPFGELTRAITSIKR